MQPDAQLGLSTTVYRLRTLYVRTFSFDPSGKMMVAASIHGMHVRKDDTVLHVPAAMSVFSVGDDGRLQFVCRYDVERGERTQYWVAMVGLP